eukprot:gene2574-2816_t
MFRGKVTERSPSDVPKKLTIKAISGFPTIKDTKLRRLKSQEVQAAKDASSSSSSTMPSLNKNLLEDIHSLITPQNAAFLQGGGDVKPGFIEAKEESVEPPKSQMEEERFDIDGGRLIAGDMAVAEVAEALLSHNDSIMHLDRLLLREKAIFYAEKIVHVMNDLGFIIIQGNVEERESVSCTFHEALALMRSEYPSQVILGCRVVSGILTKRDLITTLPAYLSYRLWLEQEKESLMMIDKAAMECFMRLLPAIDSVVQEARSLNLFSENAVVESLMKLCVHEIPATLPTLLLWGCTARRGGSVLAYLRCTCAFAGSVVEFNVSSLLWRSVDCSRALPVLLVPHAKRPVMSYEDSLSASLEKVKNFMQNSQQGITRRGTDSLSLSSEDEFALLCRWNRSEAFLLDASLLEVLFGLISTQSLALSDLSSTGSAIEEAAAALDLLLMLVRGIISDNVAKLVIRRFVGQIFPIMIEWDWSSFTKHDKSTGFAERLLLLLTWACKVSHCERSMAGNDNLIGDLCGIGLRMASDCPRMFLWWARCLRLLEAQHLDILSPFFVDSVRISQLERLLFEGCKATSCTPALRCEFDDECALLTKSLISAAARVLTVSAEALSPNKKDYFELVAGFVNRLVARVSSGPLIWDGRAAQLALYFQICLILNESSHDIHHGIVIRAEEGEKKFLAFPFDQLVGSRASQLSSCSSFLINFRSSQSSIVEHFLAALRNLHSSKDMLAWERALMLMGMVQLVVEGCDDQFIPILEGLNNRKDLNNTVRDGLLSWQRSWVIGQILLSWLCRSGQSNWGGQILPNLGSNFSAQREIILANVIQGLVMLCDCDASTMGADFSWRLSERLFSDGPDFLGREWPYQVLSFLRDKELYPFLSLLLVLEERENAIVASILPEHKLFFLLNILTRDCRSLWPGGALADAYSDVEKEEELETIVSTFVALVTLVTERALKRESLEVVEQRKCISSFLSKIGQELSVDAHRSGSNQTLALTKLHANIFNANLMGFIGNVVDCCVNVELHPEVTACILSLLTLPGCVPDICNKVWKEVSETGLIHLIDHPRWNERIVPAILPSILLQLLPSHYIPLILQSLRSLRCSEDQRLAIVRIQLLRLCLFFQSCLVLSQGKWVFSGSGRRVLLSILSETDHSSQWIAGALILLLISLLPSTPNSTLEATTVLLHLFPDLSPDNSAPKFLRFSAKLVLDMLSLHCQWIGEAFAADEALKDRLALWAERAPHVTIILPLESCPAGDNWRQLETAKELMP